MRGPGAGTLTPGAPGPEKRFPAEAATRAPGASGGGRMGGRLLVAARGVLTAGVLTLLSLAPAAAQAGTTLTMEEALLRAGEHNPAYRRALNDLELSRAERLQALGAFLPRFSLNTRTGVSLNRQLIATDNFGNPIENPFTDWKTSSSTSQSLDASLTLFNWGARSRDLDTQRAQARAREATLTARLRTLRADVVRAYRAAQQEQALLSVEEELLANRQNDLEMARRMFELAGASRVDVLTAELNVQQQEQRIQDARGQLQQALLRLRTVVGDETLEDFSVSRTLPEPFDPAGLQPRELADRAYSSSPTLIEQDAQLEVSRAQAQSARRSHWPGITLFFSGFQSLYGDDWDGFADPWPDRSRSGSSSFGITIPIFQGFDNHARIVQAEVALSNQEETVREARLVVEEAVEARFIAVRTAYQSYLISVRSEEIAGERLRLGREQFRLGSRTFTELQQDIQAAADAGRAVITQFFLLEEALANLEEMVGEELR